MYLWHWPLFQWFTAERTGLTGVALLAVRCAVTLAAATGSYLLVERPIRRARRLPRPAPAPWRRAAVAGVAAVAVFGTVPPAPRSRPPIALDAPAAAAGGAPESPASAPPVRRPGRKPGVPRVDFLGDSVAWSLGTYLPPQRETDRERARRAGLRHRPPAGAALPRGTASQLPGLRALGRPLAAGRRADDPDVAVILLDRWELMDRRLDGRWQHVGDPAFDGT